MNLIECYRCNGKGFIPGFEHVANGRCFLCMGSGKLDAKKMKNVSYSRSFINKFYMMGSNFPEDQSNMVKIKCISNEGHATAEEWILSEGDFILIGQPVCRSSWYKIPKSEWSEFIKHYAKVYKYQPIIYDLEIH
jgi:hypothetical protein